MKRLDHGPQSRGKLARIQDILRGESQICHIGFCDPPPRNLTRVSTIEEKSLVLHPDKLCEIPGQGGEVVGFRCVDALGNGDEVPQLVMCDERPGKEVIQ